MPLFHYTTVDQNGKRTKRTLEAENRFALYEQVRKKGETILSVRKERGSGMHWFSNLSNMVGTVGMNEKIVLTRNLGAMIKAGLALSRALEVIERQTKNPKLRDVVHSINDDIARGSSFHEALLKFPRVFSKLFVAMMRAGEESGSLAESLETVGLQMERSHRLKKKIQGALIYPSIIVIVMTGIGVLMLMFVVPTLTDTFEDIGAELPASTQAVIFVSNSLVNNTFLVLGSFVGFVALLIMALRTRPGTRAFEYVLLHTPIIGGLVRETNAARTARTLSSLISASVDIVQAIGITREVVQNSYFQEVLKRAEKDIQKGVPLSHAFVENTHLYPVLVGEMVAVGEETGEISTMLKEIAGFYEEEVERKTKDMSTIIEPFLMVFIGVVVGFFALSMIAPIYSISEGI